MTTEERVIAACQKAITFEKPNFAALSREYRVPVQRLRARAKGRQPITTSRVSHSRLDNAQEAALYAWIDCLDTLGVPPTAARIEASVNAMLRRAHTDAAPVDHNWVYRFIKKAASQHGYSWIKQRPMGRDRYDSMDIGVMQSFFDRIEPLICGSNAIPASHIYNFDETGFLLGQGKPQKVLTKYQECSYLPSEERGNLFTGIECIAADGWLMPPYFVGKGKYQLERWYLNNDTLPINSRIAMSSSGYSNDELAIDWLNFFIQSTQSRTTGRRLLLFDGHGSHLTWEFLEICRPHHIIACVFPSHTTNLIQPLDRSPFRALKQRFKAKNNEVASWGGDACDSGFFFREIEGIRQASLKSRTIRKSFQTRGIVPFHPELVIQPLMAELGCDNCDLQIFDGVDKAASISSDLPTSPLRNSFSARRSQQKVNKQLIEQKGAITPKLYATIERITSACIELVDQVGIMDNVLQNQLPKPPKIVRKSKRRVGLYWPLTTADAVRKVADNIAKLPKRTEEDEEDEASSEGPEALDTPVPAEKRPTYTIPNGEEVFVTYPRR